jgi:hypothetical protein
MQSGTLEILNTLQEVTNSVRTVNAPHLEAAKARLEQIFSSLERIANFLDYVINTKDPVDDLQIVLGLACIHRIVRENLARSSDGDQNTLQSFKGFLLQIIQVYCGRPSQRVKLEIRQFIASLFARQGGSATISELIRYDCHGCDRGYYSWH